MGVKERDSSKGKAWGARSEILEIVIVLQLTGSVVRKA